MRSSTVISLLLACTTLVQTAEPDAIRLPVIPAPLPKPSPAPVASLGASQLYIIDADVPCVVLASPPGLVALEQDEGPVRIRGVFVDGAGKAETRLYRGKSVYRVEAVGEGRVELLIVPRGGSVEDVLRRTIDVKGGAIPGPKPPDPLPAKSVLWGFVVVEDTAEAVAARGVMLTDPTLSSLMKARGYHWRIVDRQVSGVDGQPPADVMRMLQASTGKPYPQLFLVDVKGAIVLQQALPDTAGLVELLEKYGKD